MGLIKVFSWILVMKTKKIILVVTMLMTTTALGACDHTCKDTQVQGKNLPIVEEKAVSTPKMNIEVLVDAKIKEYISQLDKKSRLEYQNGCQEKSFLSTSMDEYHECMKMEEEDYYKYGLLGKTKIIKKDLNNDVRDDYFIEADFCEKSSCHMTTRSTVYFVFTTDKNNKINFVTQLEIPLAASVENISEEGVISIESREYDDDMSEGMCCPSVIVNQDYALVGSSLRVLAD